MESSGNPWYHLQHHPNAGPTNLFVWDNDLASARILITGATGFVGRRLVRMLQTKFPQITVLALGRKPMEFLNGLKSTQLDILESDFAEIEALIRQFHPNYVVQLAALTAFAPPEDQHEKYMRMNCHIPSKICDVCQDIGATCFYASTDMVYDGNNALYSFDAERLPASVYGRSKKAGEDALLGRAIVTRFPLLYGLGGAFFQMLYDTLKAGKQVQLFKDEWRSVAWATDICEMIIKFLEISDTIDKSRGWNFGGPSRVSRLELGLQLAKDASFDASLIQTISQVDIPSPIPRPKDLSMISTDTYAILPESLRPKSISEGVAAAIKEGPV